MINNELGFPGSSAGKESACKAGDLGSTPGLGRSPGEGNSYPLQYSGLENSTDCIAHGVAKNQDTIEWLSIIEPHINLNFFQSLAYCCKREWSHYNKLIVNIKANVLPENILWTLRRKKKKSCKGGKLPHFSPLLEKKTDDKQGDEGRRWSRKIWRRNLPHL